MYIKFENWKIWANFLTDGLGQTSNLNGEKRNMQVSDLSALFYIAKQEIQRICCRPNSQYSITSNHEARKSYSILVPLQK